MIFNKNQQKYDIKSKADSDEIKSASPSPAVRQISSRSDFIHESGFIPAKADLVKKDSELYPILSLFLVAEMGLVCPVPSHSRRLSPTQVSALPTSCFGDFRRQKQLSTVLCLVTHSLRPEGHRGQIAS